VTHNTAETDEDNGPFFDLEFAVPDEEDDAKGGDETQNKEQDGTNYENESDEEEEDERESSTSRFPLVPATTARIRICLSPFDELFFNGRLVPIEPYSLVFNPSKPNSKQPQLFPVSLLKSATKFRVSMLRLKKSKTTANAIGQKTEPNGSVASIAPKPQQEETQQKQEQPQSKSFFHCEVQGGGGSDRVPIHQRDAETRERSEREDEEKKKGATTFARVELFVQRHR
jgi:hypothetical protein